MSISSLIESVLTAHPAVSAAAVSVHGTEEGDERLVAHVVPAAPVAAAVAEDAQIAGWRKIHEALYAVGPGVAGPEGDFRGWNSAYDALPIPLEDMREWQAAALERVRELPRRRILEIGVGTGLLMDRLAREEDVQEYWATDFAASAVTALTARTHADPVLRDKVRLRRQGAEDTTGLPAGYFDAIVVNSVVQYFPSLAHLRTVVERLLPLLAPGGSVLLGDLRNLDLARCLHTGAELSRPGAAGDSREALRRSVDRRMAAETELLLSPALFAALTRELPALRTVDVRVKRGAHHNELTRYRYEAVLSTAEPAADLTAAPVVRWGREVSSVAEAEDRLNAHRPAVLRLAGIPNRRVHDEYCAMRSLDNPLESVDLAPQDAPAPDPEALCAAGEHLGYRALPTWSGEGAELLDIVFVDPDLVPAGPLTGVYVAPAAAVEECANVPTALDGTVDLEAVLRGHLRERLPDHVVGGGGAPPRGGPRAAEAVPDAEVGRRRTPVSGPSGSAVFCAAFCRAALSASRAASPGRPPGGTVAPARSAAARGAGGSPAPSVVPGVSSPGPVSWARPSSRRAETADRRAARATSPGLAPSATGVSAPRSASAPGACASAPACSADTRAPRAIAPAGAPSGVSSGVSSGGAAVPARSRAALSARRAASPGRRSPPVTTTSAATPGRTARGPSVR
ncbi:SAM-dependent methyltransferase [Streptomyces sp. NPDC058964]|uniref:SAM-dependent methyltransferase n=1 Tax=Streptomyces sp. NPDC058964 TaxID=3346681 RepID=UPI0036761987